MLAAEHIIRYDAAAQFCRGKRVLDIACGEGYGAAYMAERGASSVTAVDISEDAILSAKRNFSHRNINFVCADGVDVDRWNPTGEKFDVIACFETIEHVPSPKAFLSILQTVLADDGVILVSCPNDSLEEARGIKNPFHTDVYSFDAFKKMTTEILGEPGQWLFGSPLTGISLHDVKSSISGTDDNSIMQILNVQSADHSLVLPAQSSHKVDEGGATFYLGIWNGSSGHSIIAAPMSRSAYLEYYFAVIDLQGEARSLSSDNDRLRKTVDALDKRMTAVQRISSFETERLNERNNTLLRDNDYLREEVNKQTIVADDLRASLSMVASSRAHRIASLYIRSAMGRSTLSGYLAFLGAAARSGGRLIKRRLLG